jgi:hypothetical protein
MQTKKIQNADINMINSNSICTNGVVEIYLRRGSRVKLSSSWKDIHETYTNNLFPIID